MSLWQILSWQALFIFIIVFLSGDLEVEASKKQAELDKKAMEKKKIKKKNKTNVVEVIFSESLG